MNHDKINNFLRNTNSKERKYVTHILPKQLIVYYFNGDASSTINYTNTTTIQDVINIINKQKSNTFILFVKDNEIKLSPDITISNLQYIYNVTFPIKLFALQIPQIYLSDLLILFKIYSLYDYNTIYSKHGNNIYDILKDYRPVINKYTVLNKQIYLVNVYSNIETFDFDNIFKNIYEFIQHPNDKINFYESLQIQHYNIISFPKNLFKANQLQHLEYLNITSCYLSEVPNDIFNLYYLKYLDLSFNRIKVIPQSINQLINLREFIFHKNECIYEIKHLIDFLINKKDLLCFGICNNSLVYPKNESNIDTIMYNKCIHILHDYNIILPTKFMFDKFRTYTYRTKK